ncbi:MAG: tRNA 2-thiouridine(34) synthase MnmA [Candidatus Nealsonbacteria bacterium]
MVKKTKQKDNLRVVVAMSGGVDSSVSAALLKESGFDVIGVFMKFWAGDDLNKEYNRCCSKEAEKRARRVADVLKIPFYVIDFKKEFKRRIVDSFLVAYKKGITPNPCVVCNKEIKFGLLLKKAKSLGADFIATGHYARIKKEDGLLALIKAKDKEKDQSYFLWKLNQNQLKHILFPVGGYMKSEVRKMAKDFKLSVSDVPESQEVCFIPRTTNAFLKKYLKIKLGRIVSVKGKVLGEHQGLWFYTIGQRKGIKLPKGPFYVVAKDKKKNLLIVSKNKKDLYQKQAVLKEINWISKKAPKFLKIKAKIRYRQKLAKTRIVKIKNKYVLIFNKPQKAITSGQSAVIYDKNKVLGGGIII